MNGSFHDWLEEHCTDGCLMNMSDDATSAVELRLSEEETIRAAANTLRAWIESTEHRRRCTQIGRMFINTHRRGAN